MLIKSLYTRAAWRVNWTELDEIEIEIDLTSIDEVKEAPSGSSSICIFFSPLPTVSLILIYYPSLPSPFSLYLLAHPSFPPSPLLIIPFPTSPQPLS